MDGEGSITMATTNAGNPYIKVCVYNGNKAILDRIRSLLDEWGISYSCTIDRRGDPRKTHTNVQFSTQGALTLYPLVAPYLVRQIERFTAACEFMAPYYATKKRVLWSTAQRGEWRMLTDRHRTR